tara:strand:+ start:131 stop:760 length:630 start_codon:yes stop_codon:yes gene_type:complete
MKKLLFVITLLFSIISFGQSFEVLEEQVDEGNKYLQGTFNIITPVMVMEVTDTPNELYNKTIDWVNETYKNPDKVIKGKVEGKYVRVSGSAGALSQSTAMGMTFYYDVRYSLEIKFKENKIRYEVTKMEHYIPSSQYVTGGWRDYPFSFKVAKAKGKLNKKTQERSAGKIDKDGVKNYENFIFYFENLGLGLKKYVENSSSESSPEDDW